MYVNGHSLTPHLTGTIFVDPIEPGGETASGLVAVRHSSVPPIMGVVIDCSPDVVDAGEVKVDDVVIFRPHTLEPFEFENQTFHVLYTENIEAIIEGYFDAQ